MEETTYSNYISFDSEDRDTTKYPKSNAWGIQLPENYKNIKSIGLYDSAISYKNIYTIHHNYQNNAFIITKKSSESTITFNQFNTDTTITKNNKLLNIQRPLTPYLTISQNNDCWVTNDICNTNTCAQIAKNEQDWALKRARNNSIVKDPNNKNIHYPYYPDYTKSVYYSDFSTTTFAHSNNSDQYMIVIPNGNYTITELQAQLNQNFNIVSGGIDIEAHINPLTNSLYFKCNGDEYTFDFDIKIIYPECNQNLVFDYNSYWGLGYHLGFNKKQYTVSTYDSNIQNIYTTGIESADLSDKLYILPENSVRLSTPTVIYMEIDKYNSIYEFKNKHNKITGQANSAFAKIFIGTDVDFNGNNINGIEYTTVSKHKLFDRISNFNFKFRFHNNILVEFIDNFNFTLKLEEVI